MNLKMWSPLALLGESLLSTVRLAYVFNREVILVNDNDEVLVFGRKQSEYLELESAKNWNEPIAIPVLEKKQIKGFAFGGTLEKPFFVAYTYTGAVYFWGKIQGTKEDVILKPTLMDQFPKKISNIACGAEHCLALSVNGEVFSWGSNMLGQLGIGSLESTANPVEVRGKLNGKNVVKISCGSNFSIAVIENGDVYSWGSNGHSQLGRNDTTGYSVSPERVSLPDNIVIRKIACGPAHVLAISDVCELYVWGRNNDSELGFESKMIKSVMTPTKNERAGRVSKVAASIFCCTSAALSVNHYVLYWGPSETGSQNCYPKISPFESLHEVFAHYAPQKIMHKPMKKELNSKSIRKTIENIFDEKESSDLTIVTESREIFVHRSILRSESEYFRTLLKEEWVDTNDKSINIDRSYDALHAYLRYLYTDELKVNTNVAVVLKLAHEYNDTALKKLCEKTIQRGIQIDNVASLYVTALKLDAMSYECGGEFFWFSAVGYRNNTNIFFGMQQEGTVEVLVEKYVKF